MGNITSELYEKFKTNLENANGDCKIVKKDEVADTIINIFNENAIKDTSVAVSELMQEIDLVSKLSGAGIDVHKDNIRLHAETDKGGISEADHGIAELGTMVQESDDVDARIVSTMSEHYIGILRGSKIVDTYDEMFEILCNMKELPNYVGFVTGPSRTADIECVGTVGVHGPIKFSMIIVEDM